VTRPARILWGLPDALLCWLAGHLGAILASIPIFAILGDADIDKKLEFGVLLPAQQLAYVLAAVYVSRLKGQRSLGSDFGFRVRRSDAKLLLVGAAIELLLTLALWPIISLDPGAKDQQLLTDLKEQQDVATVALFFLGAVVFAPIVEELLFRGILLRALLRKFQPTTSILASSVIFALVHFIGDPNAFRFLPALAGLGAVLAIVTLRTGDLSQAIFLHAGFNLTTVVIVVWTSS
jgi:membrane protease YdiL (CAAX protease family)